MTSVVGPSPAPSGVSGLPSCPAVAGAGEGLAEVIPFILDGACDSQRERGEFVWLCTRTRDGHGVHVARGIDGELLDVWRDGDVGVGRGLLFGGAA